MEDFGEVSKTEFALRSEHGLIHCVGLSCAEVIGNYALSGPQRPDQVSDGLGTVVADILNHKEATHITGVVLLLGEVSNDGQWPTARLYRKIAEPTRPTKPLEVGELVRITDAESPEFRICGINSTYAWVVETRPSVESDDWGYIVALSDISRIEED